MIGCESSGYHSSDQPMGDQMYVVIVYVVQPSTCSPGVIRVKENVNDDFGKLVNIKPLGS